MKEEFKELVKLSDRFLILQETKKIKNKSLETSFLEFDLQFCFKILSSIMVKYEKKIGKERF